MNKIISRGLVILGILFTASFVSAQNVDYKVFGVETGVVLGYDVGAGTLGNQTNVNLVLTLTDNLSASFGFSTGVASLPTAATLLSLNYGLADRFGVIVSLGRDTGAATLLSGIGMYFNIFERKLQDALATNLKAKVEYLFVPASLNTGDLCVSLSVGLGM